MRSLLLVMSVLFALPLKAHEFWISPEKYMISPGDQLRAALRVGQEFEGSEYAYVPRNFRRFDLVQGGSWVPVEGRVGDRPALSSEIAAPGLVIVVHETSDSTLTYNDWQKFVNFVTHKAAEWVLAEHQSRGLPDKGFRERYSRYAKSLIAVGDGAGEDRAVGLLTEIVAEANPYTDDVSGGMPVRILYQDAPRDGAQLEVFEKAFDGTVSIVTYTADGDGRVIVPVKKGHWYLLDSVVLRALEPETENGPVWESLWAALTFQVPE